MRRNIYQGPDSCYAVHGDYYYAGGRRMPYVPGSGVNRRTVGHFISAIVNDLRRGYTYDHTCRRIPMTYRLAVRRLTYLIALARKHAPRDFPHVQRKVQKALERLKAIRPIRRATERETWVQRRTP